MGNRRVVSSRPFGRFRFDADAIAGNSAQFGYMFAKLRRVRANLGRGEDQRGIEIHELIASGGNALQGFPQKDG